MKRIVLKKKERVIVDDKIFRVVKGKVNVSDTFENGKILPKDGYLKEGDLIGNFFTHFNEGKFPQIDMEVEVVALENNTVIEEIEINENELKKNPGIKKIILQLVRDNAFKILQLLYDKKGYLLAVLKFYASKEGKLSKKEVHYENFVISKSQFYTIYTELKKENYIEEKEKVIYLNLSKVENYFRKTC